MASSTVTVAGKSYKLEPLTDLEWLHVLSYWLRLSLLHNHPEITQQDTMDLLSTEGGEVLISRLNELDSPDRFAPIQRRPATKLQRKKAKRLRQARRKARR